MIYGPVAQPAYVAVPLQDYTFGASLAENPLNLTDIDDARHRSNDQPLTRRIDVPYCRAVGERFGNDFAAAIATAILCDFEWIEFGTDVEGVAPLRQEKHLEAVARGLEGLPIPDVQHLVLEEAYRNVALDAQQSVVLLREIKAWRTKQGEQGGLVS